MVVERKKLGGDGDSNTRVIPGGSAILSIGTARVMLLSVFGTKWAGCI